MKPLDVLLSEMDHVIEDGKSLMTGAAADKQTRSAARLFVDRAVKLQLRLMAVEHERTMSEASSENNPGPDEGPKD
jgi:hypothetical protein